jgi:hypothetical protein
MGNSINFAPSSFQVVWLMLEQYSLLMIRDWLKSLLADLAISSLPMPEEWSHESSDNVQVERSPGLLWFSWRAPNADDRLKATFSYTDKGGSPLVSLVFDRNNVLQGLEVWRGDGQPLVRVPTISDFEIPIELRNGVPGTSRN